MAVDRSDRDALAQPAEPWTIETDRDEVAVNVVDDVWLRLSPVQALRLGHALVQAARKLGAR